MNKWISQNRIFAKSAIYLALYSCWIGTAYAATEATTEQTHALPMIVVTAENNTENNYTKKNASTSTKLDLSIKETPQSVSVITRKQIEDMGATNLGDALLNTTGILLTGDNTERTNFSIRGFNVGDGWNSNILQYDGVAVNASNVTSSKPDMATIESIEVLRGAAGLMQVQETRLVQLILFVKNQQKFFRQVALSVMVHGILYVEKWMFLVR